MCVSSSKERRFVFFLSFFVLLVGSPASGDRLRVAVLGESPSEAAALAAPLADDLAEALGMPEVQRGDVVVSDSVSALADEFRHGRVDVYVGGPLPAVVLSDQAGVKLVLQCGKKQDRTVIFSRKNGPVGQLVDLGGRMIAFQSPVSTFGSLFPRLLLEAKGADLRRYDSAASRVSRGNIGFVFSGDDENTLVWVERGKVAAGAMRESRYEELLTGHREDVRMIYRSVPLPAVVVGFRSTLPSVVQKGLSAAFRSPDIRFPPWVSSRKGGGYAVCAVLPEKTLRSLEHMGPLLLGKLGF